MEFPFSANLEEVIRDSDAIIVITAHQEYKNLDLTYIKTLMKDNPIIIDGRRIFDPEDVISMGFSYRGVGQRQFLY